MTSNLVTFNYSRVIPWAISNVSLAWTNTDTMTATDVSTVMVKPYSV